MLRLADPAVSLHIETADGNPNESWVVEQKRATASHKTPVPTVTIPFIEAVSAITIPTKVGLFLADSKAISVNPNRKWILHRLM